MEGWAARPRRQPDTRRDGGATKTVPAAANAAIDFAAVTARLKAATFPETGVVAGIESQKPPVAKSATMTGQSLNSFD
jgi:hypothetical protein